MPVFSLFNPVSAGLVMALATASAAAAQPGYTPPSDVALPPVTTMSARPDPVVARLTEDNAPAPGQTVVSEEILPDGTRVRRTVTTTMLGAPVDSPAVGANGAVAPATADAALDSLCRPGGVAGDADRPSADARERFRAACADLYRRTTASGVPLDSASLPMPAYPAPGVTYVTRYIPVRTTVTTETFQAADAGESVIHDGTERMQRVLPRIRQRAAPAPVRARKAKAHGRAPGWRCR